MPSLFESIYRVAEICQIQLNRGDPGSRGTLRTRSLKRVYGTPEHGEGIHLRDSDVEFPIHVLGKSRSESMEVQSTRSILCVHEQCCDDKDAVKPYIG